jgi:hypothetical protein
MLPRRLPGPDDRSVDKLRSAIGRVNEAGEDGEDDGLHLASIMRRVGQALIPDD